MSLKNFLVSKGVDIESNGEIHSILNGTTDPSVAGIPAVPGSIYMRNTPGVDGGEVWAKIGDADTSWINVGDSTGLGGDDAFQNSFMGKSSAGAESPNYTSSTVVTQGTSLEAAIGELDSAVDSISSTANVDSFNSRTGVVVPEASDYDAIQVDYDPTATNNSSATEVQSAIEDLDAAIDAIVVPVTSVHSRTGDVVAEASDYDAVQVDYDNASSGLTATEVQAAIDEVKVLVDSSITGVNYISVFDPADPTNNPTGVAPIDGDGVNFAAGDMFVVSVGGDYNFADGTQVGGETLAVGDRLFFNQDLTWEVIGNVDSVNSVFGRTGAIVALNGDYTASNITNVANGNLEAVTVQGALDELQGDIDSINAVTLVNTFNGRSGAVVPEASDYDAVQIDYDNTDSSLSAVDVKAALDELDTKPGIPFNSEDSVTVQTTVDSVLVDVVSGVKWMVTAEDGTERNSFEVNAIHNGNLLKDATVVDYSQFVILRTNDVSITGLVMDVTLNGSGSAQTMELRITSTSSVDIRVSRIDVAI